MKVLLTGAAGSLGSHTLPLLRQAGHEVIATDRLIRPDTDRDIEVVDLCDLKAVYRLLKGVDTVVHVANVAHDGFPFEQTYIANITANASVFYAAVDRGVKRVIWASTIQVCSGKKHDGPPAGRLAYLPADGDLPAIPQNSYALGKHIGEQTLEALCNWHDLEGVAIRYPWLVRYDTMRSQGARWMTTQHGRSLDSLLWLSMPDAARLLVACVDASKLPGYRTYLPANDELFIDKPLEQIVADAFPDVPRKVPLAEHGRLNDNTRITTETGWRPLDSRQKMLDLQSGPA